MEDIFDKVKKLSRLSLDNVKQKIKVQKKMAYIH